MKSTLSKEIRLASAGSKNNAGRELIICSLGRRREARGSEGSGTIRLEPDPKQVTTLRALRVADNVVRAARSEAVDFRVRA